MKKLLFTISISCIVSLAFAQQDALFKVEVSSDSVLLGNYFEVKFILINQSGTQFQPPSFEGFNVVGGPNQSSSFSMVNGKVSQSMSYSYYLEAQDIGFIFIDPASVKVGNEVLETDPLKILVLDNPDGIKVDPKSEENNSLNPFYDLQPKTTKPKKKRKVYKL